MFFIVLQFFQRRVYASSTRLVMHDSAGFNVTHLEIGIRYRKQELDPSVIGANHPALTECLAASRFGMCAYKIIYN